MLATYREFRPSPRLSRYIECYWWHQESKESKALPHHPVLPDGCSDILFSARHGEPLGLWLVGLMTTPGDVQVDVGQIFFGVRFNPGMASAFLDGPGQLTDRMVPLDNIWHASAPTMMDQLSESSTPQQMAAIMEQSLRPLNPPDAAQRALWRLAAADIPLDRLASDSGLSTRQFRRACLDRAGVSPKYLQRILRFRKAAERMQSVKQRGAQPNWAQFAAACGYYDQAHFIRDFQEFSRATPGRFLQSEPRRLPLGSGHE